MIRRTLQATAALAFTISASLAADAVDIPSANTNHTWAGMYAGAHLGYATGDATTTAISKESFGNKAKVGAFGESISVEPDGVMLGLQGGFNMQSGKFVSGLEVDFGFLDVSDEQWGYPRHRVRGLRDTGMLVDYSWYGVLAARAGVAMDRTLIYAKAGLAAAEVHAIAGDLDKPHKGIRDIDPAYSFDEAKTQMGYAIGAGVEQALNNNWSIKAEYLYMDLGSFNAFDTDNDGYETELNLHTIKVGINHKFW